MAPSRKQSPKLGAAPEPEPLPQEGDKVTRIGKESVWTVSKVWPEGKAVDLEKPGTNLQQFRVNVENLTFVERKPRASTSNPFTSAEPVFDSAELLERIALVQLENLKRSDDDIDILKTYLKTQRAPKAAIAALESLTVEQHVSWKKAVEKIEKLLED